MNEERLEAFLAKIYVDSETRSRFLSDPHGEAFKAGLEEKDIRALEKIDRVGLSLMAASLERKRMAKQKKVKSRIRRFYYHLKRRIQRSYER